MELPRIRYYESEEEAKEMQERLEKIHEMKLIIKDIETLNESPEGNYGLVYFLGKRLEDLSNNMLCVRIWKIEGLVHCVVVYPNEEVKMELGL